MSSTTVALSVTGFSGKPLGCTLERRPEGSADLAVVFPGFAYGPSAPLLASAGAIAAKHGLDVLRFDPDYPKQGLALGNEADERALLERLRADAVAVLTAGVKVHPYRRVVVVGKSLGTRAMAFCLEDARWASAIQDVRLAWLTPVCAAANVRDWMVRAAKRSLVVIGTADQHRLPAVLDEVRGAAGADAVVEIEGADHSLDVAGDAARTAAAHERWASAFETLVRDR